MADVDDRGSAGGEEEGKDLWYWNIKKLVCLDYVGTVHDGDGWLLFMFRRSSILSDVSSSASRKLPSNKAIVLLGKQCFIDCDLSLLGSYFDSLFLNENILFR